MAAATPLSSSSPVIYCSRWHIRRPGRAAITASVAFIAILADRRAVSLHSLAVAALAILLMEPEAVLQPGFEMSFCATASLVAMAEIWPHRHAARGLAWPIAGLQKGRDWLFAMIMVSLVAGAATGPFAIQHFNRVANYGVLASDLTADFVGQRAPDAGAGSFTAGRAGAGRWEQIGLVRSMRSPVLRREASFPSAMFSRTLRARR